MENENSFDIVGIGDIVIDVFIKLDIGYIEETAQGTEYCIPYGSKVPYESKTIVPAVGNSANAVVSASRLGLNTALVSFIGNDRHGKECLDRLAEEKISIKFINQENGKSTNYHYVLWFKDDRTILIQHERFASKLPDIGNPKWIYLSSLGEHAIGLYPELIKHLEKNPEIKLAFQPGTFQLKMDKELLADLYKKTAVFCVNKEEAKTILGNDKSEIKDLLDGLMKMGPKIVIITDGANGSYVRYDGKYLFMPTYPDIAQPYERTGAGDAFFSTFVTFLAKGMSVEESIKRAPINSMNVVQHIGAQEGLLSEGKLEEYLNNAPENYKLKEI